MKRKASLLVLLGACRAQAPEPELPPLALPPPVLEARSTTVAAPRPLRLGLMPVFEPDQILESYAPLASYLGEQLETVVELRLAPDYDAIVEMVARGELELVQLSPLAYVVAKERVPDLRLLLHNVAEGSSTYSGYILTRPDAGLRSLEALKGRRFGFVSPTSASGYLYPYAFLLEHGLVPQRDFAQVAMTGRHDLAIERLLVGELDAVATFSGALLNAEARGFEADQLHILAKTGRIPYDAWCASGKLEPGVAARIEASLLKLSTRTRLGRSRLGPLRSINGFARAEDRYYDEIRRVKRVVDEAHADPTE